MPRKMLPPPTTMAISTPPSRTMRDLLGERVEDLGVDAVAGVAHERLAGELEQDALEPVLLATVTPLSRVRRRAPRGTPQTGYSTRAGTWRCRPVCATSATSPLVRAASSAAVSPSTKRVEARRSRWCRRPPCRSAAAYCVDRDVRVLHEGLLDEADLLVELLEATLRPSSPGSPRACRTRRPGPCRCDISCSTTSAGDLLAA